MCESAQASGSASLRTRPMAARRAFRTAPQCTRPTTPPARRGRRGCAMGSSAAPSLQTVLRRGSQCPALPLSPRTLRACRPVPPAERPTRIARVSALTGDREGAIALFRQTEQTSEDVGLSIPLGIGGSIAAIEEWFGNTELALSDLEQMAGRLEELGERGTTSTYSCLSVLPRRTWSVSPAERMRRRAYRGGRGDRGALRRGRLFGDDQTGPKRMVTQDSFGASLARSAAISRALVVP